jgi:DNA polymerase-3 subunit delta
MLKGAPARSGAMVRWSRDDGWAGLERLVLAMCRVKLPRTAPYN